MPEGDTIHRTAAALRSALLGKPVTAFDAPRLTGTAPAVGSVVERVESWGKHLEIGFDDGVVLHTHMRMSGSWHLYHPGQRWRKSARAARVVIEVPGWQAVCFSAPVVETYRHKELTRHPVAGSLGPDLCRVDADIAACVERMDAYAEPETMLTEVMLDQRIACGVGNVYKSEVLWAVGLHPLSQLGAIDEDTRRSLIDTASRLLRANLGGAERITLAGGLAVYGRTGKPCARCGAPIEVARHGEQARVTYWCPGCQQLVRLSPTGDGDGTGDGAPADPSQPHPYEIPRPWRSEGREVEVGRARLSFDWEEWDDDDAWAEQVDGAWSSNAHTDRYPDDELVEVNGYRDVVAPDDDPWLADEVEADERFEDEAEQRLPPVFDLADPPVKESPVAEAPAQPPSLPDAPRRLEPIDPLL